jgi:hypothetical protein
MNMYDVRAVDELPESKLLVASDRLETLAEAIATVANRFTHTEPVKGAPQSIRLLLQKSTNRSAPLPGSLDALGVARELLVLQPDARYDSLTPSSGGQVKGWEIGRVIIESVPAVLARAVWVSPAG